MILIVALLCFGLLGWYTWWNRSALFVQAAHKAFRQGNEEATLEAFAKAEAAGRLSADSTASYAYLSLKNGRTEDAGLLLDHALATGRRGRPLKPSDRRLLETYKALVLWKQERLGDAVDLLEGLLALGYRTATLYGNLGFFLILQGNLPRAEALCLEAAEWDPEGKVILDNLASLYLEKEQWRQAAEVYDRLLALEPRFPEAWHGGGWAAWKTGDAAEAQRRWRRALELPFHSLTTVERPAIEKALEELNLD